MVRYKKKRQLFIVKGCRFFGVFVSQYFTLDKFYLAWF
jgi:hypothetical protein